MSVKLVEPITYVPGEKCNAFMVPCKHDDDTKWSWQHGLISRLIDSLLFYTGPLRDAYLFYHKTNDNNY